MEKVCDMGMSPYVYRIRPVKTKPYRSIKGPKSNKGQNREEIARPAAESTYQNFPSANAPHIAAKCPIQGKYT